MKKLCTALTALAFLAPVQSQADEVLSRKQILQALDGKIFNVSPRDTTIWTAVWVFDFAAGESRVLASPRGPAVLGLELKGNQLCNSKVPSGPMTQAGLRGCFDIVRRKKSLYFNKGKRKVFVLRRKGVIQ
ncbi:MAG: hypothetical protein GY952_03100 [Rhodobacteraceae bacterium]|nr:hypothetical protein [Paracoccaceae bacterium]